MSMVTTLLDLTGLALLVAAGWLLAGLWLAALVGGVALLWLSRSLSGAPPVLAQVAAIRADRAA